MLIILAIRAFESQHPDALMKDEKAVALVSQMDQDFLRSKLAKVEDYSQVAIILRSRERSSGPYCTGWVTSAGNSAWVTVPQCGHGLISA